MNKAVVRKGGIGVGDQFKASLDVITAFIIKMYTIPQPLEEMLFEFMEGTAAIDSTGNLLGSGDVK